MLQNKKGQNCLLRPAACIHYLVVCWDIKFGSIANCYVQKTVLSGIRSKLLACWHSFKNWRQSSVFFPYFIMHVKKLKSISLIDSISDKATWNFLSILFTRKNQSRKNIIKIIYDKCVLLVSLKNLKHILG